MNDYVLSMRREFHENPEIGFNLPKTLAILRRELDKIGVEYTESYGKSSIVATVNPEKSHFTIGIRADIDALPISEENDVPYKSKIEGQMHACGHDAHNAIALATLKEIYEMRDKITCRVKFIFQAAEEFAPSGAMLMARDGVMDEIDEIVALHCDPTVPFGSIAIMPEECNAESNGFSLDFYGTSSHVANQEKGRDAIMMCMRAYSDIEFLIAKEVAAREPVIFNVGAIHGGETNNIICNHCSMFCTLRTFNSDIAKHLIDKIKRICAAVAETADGRFEFNEKKHYPIVYNNPLLAKRLKATIEKVVGSENTLMQKRGMGGEDFSYFANIKPGCMFRLGTRSGPETSNVLHTKNFNIDERALEIGVNIFKTYVLDNMK